eukprot:4306642-Pyramimonas_sp.AAC.1
MLLNGRRLSAARLHGIRGAGGCEIQRVQIERPPGGSEAEHAGPARHQILLVVAAALACE